jgi:acetyl-CoA carboxylase carboxyl transferase subunit beta
LAAWFSRSKAPKPTTEEGDRLEIPGGLWTKCPSCSAIVYTRELERNNLVCTQCSFHFRLSADQRIQLLCDRHSFEELDAGIRSNDPLQFRDSIKYKERLKRAEKKSGAEEAVMTGRARLDGKQIVIGVFNFAFMGGSMGTVVGEKLTRAVETATLEKVPMIIVSASGGARMHEGIYSLMQMAKITAALVRHSDAGLPYISLLTDPTTGGVAASFSMQGDIIIAEPGALIGFAGPRVIEQTIKKKLPEGFQRSEFLLEHGMIDLVSKRGDLKRTVSTVLDYLHK